MKHFATVVLGVVGVAAIVAIASVVQAPSSPASREAHADDPRVQNVDVVATGSSWKALCPTVDGGVAKSDLLNIDGGTVDNVVSDYEVINTSATAVRVGLDSRTDENHGAPVGNCAACVGMTQPMHAKIGNCKSTGAAVVVDVVGGAP